MAIQLKPISKEYLISSLKGFEKYILNNKYQEKGIQPDWDESDADSASFIKNKPSSLPASDVPEWAKEQNKPSYSKEEVGLGNVDNTSDEDKPVSTAQQEELDKKIDKTTVATDSTLGLIKSGEDIDVDNNGNVNVKDNSHNHKVENISDLTASASEINILDGITASTDELNHITGVTDNIQTQLDGKAPATHTHDDRYYTESEIDDKLTVKFADLKTVAFSGSYNDLADKPNIPQNKEDIGLGNIDNTSDIDKPVSTAQQTAITSTVSEHNTSEVSHSDIRNLITELTNRLNALADSDDTTLDQMSEIVTYIKNNKDLIDAVTTSKVSVDDIIDDLDSTFTNKPLSSKQGNVLKELITSLTTSVGNKVDKVSGKGLSTNDYTTDEKNKLKDIATGAEVNVQADWNETDSASDAFIKNKPTSMPASDVHDWAKAETKPEYSKSEVGLDKVPNVSTNNQTPTFTEATTRTNIASGEKLSVIFGKIMKWFTDLKDVAFSGSYNDLSDKPTIPTKTSELTNDSGYKTTEYGVVSKTANGLVPQLPNETTTTKYLRQDGTWVTPPNTQRTITDNLTSTSTSNALSANQGRVLKNLVDGKADKNHTHSSNTRVISASPSTFFKIGHGGGAYRNYGDKAYFAFMVCHLNGLDVIHGYISDTNIGSTPDYYMSSLGGRKTYNSKADLKNNMYDNSIGILLRIEEYNDDVDGPVLIPRIYLYTGGL